MHVEFYQLIQEEMSSVDMAAIPGTAFDAPHETMRETFEIRFAELIESIPEDQECNCVVADPPGANHRDRIAAHGFSRGTNETRQTSARTPPGWTNQ